MPFFGRIEIVKSIEKTALIRQSGISGVPSFSWTWNGEKRDNRLLVLKGVGFGFWEDLLRQ